MEPYKLLAFYYYITISKKVKVKLEKELSPGRPVFPKSSGQIAGRIEAG